MHVLFWVLSFIGTIVVLKILYRLFLIVLQFYVYKKKDFPKRYGKSSYVIITGASRGQGKEFSLQFAKSGMNVILVGSERCKKVKQKIHELYPQVDVIVLEKDFSEAFEPSFFEEIEYLFQTYDISIVVNNVGYRTGWLRYEDMPPSEIKDCLAVCTMVQSIMLQLAIKKFKHRTKHNCAVINITSQCNHPTDILAMNPEISLPYLSVYEASKAFDYYHSNSVYKEIQERFGHIDYLTVTPGAVITENTKPMLEKTAFCISDSQFVSNILRTLGNRNGVVCGATGHAMSGILINICPIMKDGILSKVSKTIASTQQERVVQKMSLNHNVTEYPVSCETCNATET